MKREIRFRAWHKIENKMCNVRILNILGGAFLVGVKPGEDIQISDKELVIAPPDGRFCPHEDIELMQYTGLKDKNGKEIYEGDILQTQSGLIGAVSYHEERGGFIFQDGYNEMLYQRMIRVEIIGNIHENPELLK